MLPMISCMSQHHCDDKFLKAFHAFRLKLAEVRENVSNLSLNQRLVYIYDVDKHISFCGNVND